MTAELGGMVMLVWIALSLLEDRSRRLPRLQKRNFARARLPASVEC